MKAIVDLAKRMLGIKSPSELYLRRRAMCLLWSTCQRGVRYACLAKECADRAMPTLYTLDCPNSALCYSRPDKPYYEEK